MASRDEPKVQAARLRAVAGVIEILALHPPEEQRQIITGVICMLDLAPQSAVVDELIERIGRKDHG